MEVSMTQMLETRVLSSILNGIAKGMHSRFLYDLPYGHLPVEKDGYPYKALCSVSNVASTVFSLLALQQHLKPSFTVKAITYSLIGIQGITNILDLVVYSGSYHKDSFMQKVQHFVEPGIQEREMIEPDEESRLLIRPCFYVAKKMHILIFGVQIFKDICNLEKKHVEIVAKFIAIDIFSFSLDKISSQTHFHLRRLVARYAITYYIYETCRPIFKTIFSVAIQSLNYKEVLREISKSSTVFLKLATSAFFLYRIEQIFKGAARDKEKERSSTTPEPLST